MGDKMDTDTINTELREIAIKYREALVNEQFEQMVYNYWMAAAAEHFEDTYNVETD